MKYGYARVSTDDQNSALQLDALKRAGCKKIFTDEGLSGATTSRPSLLRCLKTLKAGDTLTVWKLDRLARSVRDLIAIIEDLSKRNVNFRSLTEEISTTTPGGKLVFHIFAAIAEFERGIIRERTQAGITEAKRRGVKFGRKGILKDYQVEHALQLIGQGENVTDIAASLRVGRATLYRAIAQYDRQHSKPLPLRARNSKKKHR
jgi:DNA invertase Pin-like site-specific DNA recombinase